MEDKKPTIVDLADAAIKVQQAQIKLLEAQIKHGEAFVKLSEARLDMIDPFQLRNVPKWVFILLGSLWLGFMGWLIFGIR